MHTHEDVIRMYLDDHDLQQVILYLQSKLSPFLIILFGSCVRGTMRSDSDVDLAFLSDEKQDVYEIFMMAQELAAKLSRDVDLVDLQSASTVMKTQIVSSGRVIFCNDEVRRMTFFMNTLKEYAVLNEERRPVLLAIRQRKAGVGQ